MEGGWTMTLTGGLTMTITGERTNGERGNTEPAAAERSACQGAPTNETPIRGVLTCETESCEDVSDLQHMLPDEADSLESVATHIPKSKNWYAVQIHSGTEVYVCNRLEEKGLSIYHPTCDRPGSPRPVRLLPGYVLAHIEPAAQDFALVRNTPHVISILGTAGRPVSIPEGQVEWIRRMVQELTAQPGGAVEGDWVRVIRGSLVDIEGQVVRLKGALRLFVELSILGRSVSVEIDRLDVEVIRAKRARK